MTWEPPFTLLRSGALAAVGVTVEEDVKGNLFFRPGNIPWWAPVPEDLKPYVLQHTQWRTP